MPPHLVPQNPAWSLATAGSGARSLLGRPERAAPCRTISHSSNDRASSLSCAWTRLVLPLPGASCAAAALPPTGVSRSRVWSDNVPGVEFAVRMLLVRGRVPQMLSRPGLGSRYPFEECSGPSCSARCRSSACLRRPAAPSTYDSRSSMSFSGSLCVVTRCFRRSSQS
jgi:hypothetical protein